MAYCEWMVDSDLWVYADSSFGGLTMMIAKNRHVIEEEFPELPSLPTSFSNENLEFYEEWNRIRKLQHEIIMRSPLIDIELPYAGASLRFKTLKECLEFTKELREIGFQVRQCDIDEMEKHIVNPPPWLTEVESLDWKKQFQELLDKADQSKE